MADEIEAPAAEVGDDEVIGMANCFHVDILAKLDQLAVDLERIYGEYRFGEIAQRLYDFLWGEFCDKFLEAVKGDLRESATPEARAVTLSVFDTVMSRFLQLLHPYMPHVTEELSLRMGYLEEGEFLMQAPLPDEPVLAGLAAEEIAAEQSKAAAIYETAGRVRNLKAEYHVGSRRDVKLVVKGAVEWLSEQQQVLALLSKEIARIEQEVVRCETKLGNESFVARAPAAVVEQEKARIVEWQGKLVQLREMLSGLG
jgi:valyl-tRNA synthetase